MVKVAIDIGHGSNTYPPSKGITRNGVRYPEHSFNAKLGMRIKELLEQSGIQVVLGQQPNKPDVPLGTRTSLYDREKVDLVFSVHANYNADQKVNGRCAFYWHTSSKGKRMAEMVIEEIRKKGYSTHGNGLHASMVGSWTNLHMTRVPSMPAVLVEHGFMSGNKDFDLVFGSKQAQYIEDMAEADARAICRFLGVTFKGGQSKPAPSKPQPAAKSVEQLAQEVIKGQHGTGDARKKALGSQYSAVQKRVNEIFGGKSPAPTPAKKSNAVIAQEVIDGKWGNNPQRKQKLEAAGYNYAAIQSEVNRLAVTKPKKTIDQMAREVIAGKHGQGHANRQKSLGISAAEYQKVRARVNQLV